MVSGQPCWQPCAATLAALRCHAGSPALPSWQPCTSGLAALLAALRGSGAANVAALRWQAGSPARQHRCRTTLKESGGAHISRSPGAFWPGFFYERGRGHPPERPERPAGAPRPPSRRGRLFAPVLRLRFLAVLETASNTGDQVIN